VYDRVCASLAKKEGGRKKRGNYFSKDLSVFSMIPHAVLMSASDEVSGGASRMMSSCVGLASRPFLANYAQVMKIINETFTGVLRSYMFLAM
jgi:hypothetical protein